MLPRRSVIVLASIALISGPVLAACSSDSGTATSSSPATSGSITPTPEVSPSESLVGGDPSTWTPVEVTQSMNGDPVKLVVGQHAVFTDLPAVNKNNVIVLHAKFKGIVKITQPTATSNGGFQATTPGKTRITVWDGKPGKKKSQVIMYVVAHVSEDDGSGSTQPQ